MMLLDVPVMKTKYGGISKFLELICNQRQKIYVFDNSFRKGINFVLLSICLISFAYFQLLPAQFEECISIEKINVSF